MRYAVRTSTGRLLVEVNTLQAAVDYVQDSDIVFDRDTDVAWGFKRGSDGLLVGTQYADLEAAMKGVAQ